MPKRFLAHSATRSFLKSNRSYTELQMIGSTKMRLSSWSQICSQRLANLVPNDVDYASSRLEVENWCHICLGSRRQGWVTLQLTWDSGYSRGFLSARSVTRFLSDVYPATADEIGRMHIIAYDRDQFSTFQRRLQRSCSISKYHLGTPFPR